MGSEMCIRDSTRGITNWGQRFRFGLFEIPEQDFEIISAAMDPKVGQ